MSNLSDTQLILLSHAAQRSDDSLLPLPSMITAPRPAVDKSLGSLLKRALVDEVEIGDASGAWQQDGDHHYGLRINDAGRAAIGLDVPSNESTIKPAVKMPTKASLVLDMLRHDGGATLDDLIVATGWLPHTTRAALTGLRDVTPVFSSTWN